MISEMDRFDTAVHYPPELRAGVQATKSPEDFVAFAGSIGYQFSSGYLRE